MLPVLLSALAIVAALAVPRFVSPGELGRLDTMERLLRRSGPLAVGLISPLFIWWIWDQAVPVAVIHDEASYLLQADIFASGRWTVPTPALPAFFEQPHVQIAPAVASKYPPGHALVLTLGTLLGFRTLMPLLLTGITAALLFLLATRVANAWVGLLAWAFWITSPIVMLFQATYMSQLTTTALVLGSWWALLEWRETNRRRWLLTLAATIGWGAITRPLTMLVFAIPIGVVVLRDVARLRLWRDFALAAAVGAAFLAILPLWSAKTTGDWRLSPVEKYRQDYLPYDRIGFTADTTEPRRRASMSQVLTETYDYFLEAKREQGLADLPRTVRERALALTRAIFHRARLPLVIFALAGLFFLTPPLRLAVASALLLFAAHLPYGHWPAWTVYYLEAAPVAATVMALGVWRAAARASSTPRAPIALVLATLIVAAIGAPNARYWRDTRRETAIELQRDLARAIAQLPQPGILFVRYSPRIMHNPAIVRNHAHPDRAGIWVVHDRGPDNAELQRLHPDRKTHVLNVDRIVQQTPAPSPTLP